MPDRLLGKLGLSVLGLLGLVVIACQQVPNTQGPNIEATVEAAVQAALPKPTHTPTPDIPLTVEAQVQERLAAIPTPTPTSVPPTQTPRPTPTRTPRPPTPTPTLKTIIDRARPAVVRIEAGLSTGSGFITQVGFPTANQSETALVLTNNHVIEGATTVEVVVNDLYRYEAEVWGVDPGNDIALLRICCGSFEALEWADSSDISEGDPAIAIGYPLGLSGKASVTDGIISAERYEFGQWVIQTDAAINPGNSGGPLISSSGEVLGINTRKEFYSSDGRPVDGLGFAVSLKTIKSVLEDLKSGYMKPVPTPTWTPVPPPTATPTPTPSVSRSNGLGTWYIPSVLGTVTRIRFYESGYNGVAINDRQYSRFFDGSEARFINFEMKVLYPLRYANPSFDLEFVYYWGGLRMGSFTRTHGTLSYTSELWHSDGWGESTKGEFYGWRTGDWVVELYSDGILIATGEFGVY